MPKSSNSAWRWNFTVSTLMHNSAASSRFEGAVAKRAAASGRQSATITRRWAGLIRGGVSAAPAVLEPPPLTGAT
jgi:hypothetical protein